MELTRGARTRPTVRMIVAATAVAVLAIGVGAGPAAAAKKVKACTIVPQAQLETAVGNTFETPQDSSIGSFEASCRFGSADVGGTDLNLFLSTDVKGGVKNAPGGAFFATRKSFQSIYDAATPVTGVGVFGA